MWIFQTRVGGWMISKKCVRNYQFGFTPYTSLFLLRLENFKRGDCWCTWSCTSWYSEYPTTPLDFLQASLQYTFSAVERALDEDDLACSKASTQTMSPDLHSKLTWRNFTPQKPSTVANKDRTFSFHISVSIQWLLHLLHGTCMIHGYSWTCYFFP